MFWGKIISQDGTFKNGIRELNSFNIALLDKCISQYTTIVTIFWGRKNILQDGTFKNGILELNSFNIAL